MYDRLQVRHGFMNILDKICSHIPLDRNTTSLYNFGQHSSIEPDLRETGSTISVGGLNTDLNSVAANFT